MKTNKKDIENFMIDDATYKTILTTKYKNRTKWETPDLNKIVSYIPGTIVKIHINEGDKVKKGQKLFILEAMKMKNNIVAPKSGIVKKIHINIDERVPKNELLLEII